MVSIFLPGEIISLWAMTGGTFTDATKSIADAAMHSDKYAK
jgi:hypothetical protein